MNERIAKLYDQALMLEGNGDYVAGELDPEKFAELIVQECAERLLNDAKLTDIQTTRCVASIKEHFGVE